MRRATVGLTLLLALVVPDAAPAHTDAAGRTTRVNLTSTGKQATEGSLVSSISADGRFVVFDTTSALVPGDTNGLVDVYVRDRQARTTRRVSVPLPGRTSRGNTFGFPSTSISATGRYIAFTSAAPNLVAGDGDDTLNAFVRDMVTGTTVQVDVGPAGEPADVGSAERVSISADGRTVAFTSDAGNLAGSSRDDFIKAFVRDLSTGTTRRIDVTPSGGPADGHVFNLALSADGATVVFESTAGNLVAGDTNELSDVFARDLRTGVTTRVSVSSSGEQATGQSYRPAVSGDGRYVTFDSPAGFASADTDGKHDIYLHDRATATTTLVSRASAGGPSNNHSFEGRISADGRFVAFHNFRTTGPNADVFLVELATGATSKLSVTPTGGRASGKSIYPAISADGSAVAFASDAPDLVAADTNGETDIFVWDRTP